MSFSNPRSERGADILEAALVLPLLLALMFGVYTFGRGWDLYQTMTRAAREGVRQAVTTNCAMCGDTSYSTSTVQSDYVFPALQAAGIDTSNTLLQSSYQQGETYIDSADTVCGVYITFSYPFKVMLPFLPVSLTSIDLTTKVQMRLENQPLAPATCG